MELVFRNEALDATLLAEFHQASAADPGDPMCLKHDFDRRSVGESIFGIGQNMLCH
jgi:hypothetical protein